MDGKSFDDLTRTAASGASRRGALGLLAGAALAAGLAKFDLAAAKKNGGGKGKGNGGGKGKGKGKNKRCKKLNQDCGGKKKCCKGLFCVDGTCGCATGQIPSDGKCINPEPPECTVNNDCGNNEICQNGACIPAPECVNDNQCGDNEECQGGDCICPSVLGDRCVVQCDVQADCPGACGCRGTFPGDGDRIVCVDEPFDLCGVASCSDSDDCDADEICTFTTCDSPAGSGRCFPICVG